VTPHRLDPATAGRFTGAAGPLESEPDASPLLLAARADPAAAGADPPVAHDVIMSADATASAAVINLIPTPMSVKAAHAVVSLSPDALVRHMVYLAATTLPHVIW